MKDIFIYEKLQDKIINGTATPKEIKKYVKIQLREGRKFWH